MRVGLYARCSGIDPSSDLQRKALLEYAAKHGWAPVEFIDHEPEGRGDSSHPSLDALLAAAQRHEIDVVAVTRLDHLGHSFQNLLDILGQLEVSGTVFASIDDGIETRMPVSRFIAKIRGACDRCAAIRSRTA